MPDVHALLNDATDRAPHPDPVRAVHARVRRRAVRHRAALAGAATVAVAATGAVAARPSADRRPSRLAAAASPSPILSVGPGPHGYAFETEYLRLRRLVEANPDVFLDLHVEGSATEPGWQAALAFAADADPAAWRDRIDDAAGALPWGSRRCPGTAAHYANVAAEVSAARWPSGTTLAHPPTMRAALYDTRCVVWAPMTGVPTAADRAYARTQWGDDVLIAGPKPAG
jgi:hypothetical protein